MSLDIAPYRESQTYVLKGFDEVQVLLDDHIVMTQAMAFSPFKGPFAQRIEDWEKVRGRVRVWVRVRVRVTNPNPNPNPDPNPNPNPDPNPNPNPTLT